MIQQRPVGVLPLELYTNSRVLSGQVLYPAGSRLSELLNGLVAVVRHVKSEFIGLADCTDVGNVSVYQNKNNIYIRKSAIRFASISDPDAGRGLGANRDQKDYPFVRKSPVVVTLDLPPYTITGSIHCGQGQTIQDVLDDDRVFLPLTSVTIAHENHLYGTRPFVAVNKQQIESIRED